MAYRVEVEGLKELVKMLKELEDSFDMVASMSLFEGAAVVASAVNREAKSIKTAPFHYVAVPGAIERLPSPEEKEIVTREGAMGIAKFRKNLGAIDTSVGYNAAGYAPVTWNHMSSKARTNYKAATFKGRDITASSTLKWIRDQGGSKKYGLSADIGKGAQNMKPVGVIAASINSGTSFMKKQPFIRRGYNKSSREAVDKIVSTAEKILDKIIAENESGGKTA